MKWAAPIVSSCSVRQVRRSTSIVNQAGIAGAKNETTPAAPLAAGPGGAHVRVADTAFASERLRLVSGLCAGRRQRPLGLMRSQRRAPMITARVAVDRLALARVSSSLRDSWPSGKGDAMRGQRRRREKG
jgi:hypothetical protein